MSERVHYIDWLRVLAVLLLFPFHTGRVFNVGEAFYVKGAETSLLLSATLGFIDRWHMPLLFLLAGASTFLALGKRTGGAFMAERAKRLLVPFVFGVLVLIPPQTWIGAKFNSSYTGDFLGYITSGAFLAWNIRDGGDFYGGFGLGHIWFVLWLFLVVLMALPLVLWARGKRGSAWVARWSRRLASPLWWLLPPLLIWIGDGLPDIFGKNPFYYLVFFVLGFVALATPDFADSAKRYAVMVPCLVAGAAITVWSVLAQPLRDSLPDPSWALFAVNYAAFLGKWLLLVGLIGAGKRWLDSPSPALSYLAEASYQVYILHQTVIVLFAYLAVTLPLAWGLQWALLLAASVAVTFALYEGVRRVAPLRFLFGMRPAKAAA